MRHFYKNIKGWFCAEKLFRQQVKAAVDGAHFVELGPYLGKSTAHLAVEILNSGKSIKFDTIDIFEGDTGSRRSKDHDGHKEDSVEAQCRENLAAVSDVVNILKADAIEAASGYADESIDFIFIDDYHETEHVYQELIAWWPKLKVGGLLSGDDYRYRGNNGNQVPRAIKRFIAFIKETEGVELVLQKPWHTGIKKCWKLEKVL